MDFPIKSLMSFKPLYSFHDSITFIYSFLLPVYSLIIVKIK